MSDLQFLDATQWSSRAIQWCNQAKAYMQDLQGGGDKTIQLLCITYPDENINMVN